jgi:hypothetical protein
MKMSETPALTFSALSGTAESSTLRVLPVQAADVIGLTRATYLSKTPQPQGALLRTLNGGPLCVLACVRG